MSRILGAPVVEQGVQWLLRVHQLQMQVKHWIRITTAQNLDYISLLHFLDNWAIKVKNNVSLAVTAVEPKEEILFANFISISIQFNTYFPSNKLCFNMNSFAWLVNHQITFGIFSSLPHNCDGIVGRYHHFLAEVFVFQQRGGLRGLSHNLHSVIQYCGKQRKRWSKN